MKEKDYIINQIKEWAKRFKGIKLRYAFDTKTNFHVVEVLPEKIRRGDEEFVEQEFLLDESFAKIFPNADLLITEPNSLTESISTVFETENNDVKPTEFTVCIKITDFGEEPSYNITLPNFRKESAYRINIEKPNYSLAA